MNLWLVSWQLVHYTTVVSLTNVQLSTNFSLPLSELVFFQNISFTLKSFLTFYPQDKMPRKNNYDVFLNISLVSFWPTFQIHFLASEKGQKFELFKSYSNSYLKASSTLSQNKLFSIQFCQFWEQIWMDPIFRTFSSYECKWNFLFTSLLT